MDGGVAVVITHTMSMQRKARKLIEAAIRVDDGRELLQEQRIAVGPFDERRELVIAQGSVFRRQLEELRGLARV